MAIATLGHSTRSCTVSGGGTVDMQQNSEVLNDSQIANASVSRLVHALPMPFCDIPLYVAFLFRLNSVCFPIFPPLSEDSDEDAQGEGADHAQVVHGPQASGQPQAQVDSPMENLLHQVLFHALI